MRTGAILAVLASLAALPGCGVVAPKALVVSTLDDQVRFPLRSESRLLKYDGGWTVVGSLLSIQQAGDSARIQIKGVKGRHDNSERALSIAEFRTFWDSLGQLGFWQLQDTYEAPWRGEGRVSGWLAVSCEFQDQETTAKTVHFSNPEACSLKFREVYHLFRNMARFAQPASDSLRNAH